MSMIIKWEKVDMLPSVVVLAPAGVVLLPLHLPFHLAAVE